MNAFIAVMLLLGPLGASARPKALSYLWPPRETTQCLDFHAHPRPGLKTEDQALLNFAYFTQTLGKNFYKNGEILAAIDLWEITESERPAFIKEFERLAGSHVVVSRLEFRWRPSGGGACATPLSEAR